MTPRFMAGKWAEGWGVTCVEVEKYNAAILVTPTTLTERAAKAVCEKLNAAVRMSQCHMCGGVKPSDINSSYFSACPDKPFDSDWDGCVQGMGT